MRANERLISTIDNYLFTITNFAYYRLGDVANYNLNKLFVSVYSEDNYIEIPIIMYHSVIAHTSIDFRNAVLPLSFASFSTSYKSADSVLINILKYTPRRDEEIMKIKSDKYGTWYGCKSILLNESLTAVLLPVYYGYKNRDGTYSIKGIKLYVSPKVTLSDFGIHRIIYNKIIPYLLNTELYNRVIVNGHPIIKHEVPMHTNVSVEFLDIHKRFISSVIPPKVEDINEHIYKILEDNVETIKSLT